MSKISAVLALPIVTMGLLVHAQCLELADDRFAVRVSGQELNEDDALDRFEIDELFLPRLNVVLPALFEWSRFESAYLA